MSRKWIILAVLAIATSARAAHLSDIQGGVLVNNLPVSQSIEVFQGDRIKALDGSATLVYCNGSAIAITPGQTIAVLACPSETAPVPVTSSAFTMPGVQGSALLLAGGLGVGLAIALSESGPSTSP